MFLSLGTRRIYQRACLDERWASPSIAGLPHHIGLVSDFCTSSPRFALSFLQIPGRPGHPCLRLTVPVITARRELSSPRNKTCQAHKDREFRTEVLLSLIGNLKIVASVIGFAVLLLRDVFHDGLVSHVSAGHYKVATGP